MIDFEQKSGLTFYGYYSVNASRVDDPRIRLVERGMKAYWQTPQE